jgi:hypothetical protein
MSSSLAKRPPFPPVFAGYAAMLANTSLLSRVAGSTAAHVERSWFPFLNATTPSLI